MSATPVMTDRRAEWSAWKQQTFGDGYQIWHEGLDIDAVRRLHGEPRERALDMLRLGLELDDEHAAQALAAMADEASDAAVRAHLARATGSPRVRIALALHLARPEPALARHLIDVLGTHDPFGGSVDAAIGLRHFAGADVEAALMTAVGDEHYLVRYHACESLLRRRGLRRVDLAVTHPRIFALIRDDEAPPRHEAAREQLQRLARRRRPT